MWYRENQSALRRVGHARLTVGPEFNNLAGA